MYKPHLGLIIDPSQLPHIRLQYRTQHVQPRVNYRLLEQKKTRNLSKGYRMKRQRWRGSCSLGEPLLFIQMRHKTAIEMG